MQSVVVGGFDHRLRHLGHEPLVLGRNLGADVQATKPTTNASVDRQRR